MGNNADHTRCSAMALYSTLGTKSSAVGLPKIAHVFPDQILSLAFLPNLRHLQDICISRPIRYSKPAMGSSFPDKRYSIRK